MFKHCTNPTSSKLVYKLLIPEDVYCLWSKKKRSFFTITTATVRQQIFRLQHPQCRQINRFDWIKQYRETTIEDLYNVSGMSIISFSLKNWTGMTPLQYQNGYDWTARRSCWLKWWCLWGGIIVVVKHHSLVSDYLLFASKRYSTIKSPGSESVYLTIRQE